jgi:hypothetical protein
LALVELGVDAPGFVELVFQDDDAPRGVEGSAVVDQRPDPSGQPQLIAGVAAVSSGRALRDEQLHLIEAAEKAGRGALHGVGLLRELLVLVPDLLQRRTGVDPLEHRLGGCACRDANGRQR